MDDDFCAGESLKKLEKEKGIVIRFVIGKSGSGGGKMDRAIDAEEAENGDFLRLRHVEGYHQLSTKTRLYFSTAAALWEAEFYVKVDDDVHVNLGKQIFLVYIIYIFFLFRNMIFFFFSLKLDRF